MPVVRTAWDDFPPLVVHAHGTRLEQHPIFAETYATAKRGDPAKARFLVKELFKRKRSTRALIAYPKIDYVVPVLSRTGQGTSNAIPLELARALAVALQAQVWPHIVQDTVADGLANPLCQPSFTGPVLAGKTYALVDDVMGLGSALANLRGWIVASGGQVLFANVCSSERSLRLSPKPESMLRLENRWEAAVGTLPFPLEYLTDQEVGWLGSVLDAGGVDLTGLVARKLNPKELREFRRTIAHALRKGGSTAAPVPLQEISA